jgi:hypothetical protein
MSVKIVWFIHFCSGGTADHSQPGIMPALNRSRSRCENNNAKKAKIISVFKIFTKFI